MRVLLDTHAFIWLDANPGCLSPNVQSLLLDPNSELLLSSASVWEMAIKLQLGKLQLCVP